MDRPPRQPPTHGNFVFDLGIRLRRRLELAVPGWISFSGWTWYRRFVGIRADVYRRNCACKIARTPGRSFPVQCSVRHSPRLFLELPDRASGLRSGRMALGIRRDRHPRGTLFSDAVWHPPEPTVAGEKRDRKSTRLNSSHGYISYAVFCLKKKMQIDKILMFK